MNNISLYHVQGTSEKDVGCTMHAHQIMETGYKLTCHHIISYCHTNVLENYLFHVLVKSYYIRADLLFYTRSYGTRAGRPCSLQHIVWSRTRPTSTRCDLFNLVTNKRSTFDRMVAYNSIQSYEWRRYLNRIWYLICQLHFTLRIELLFDASCIIIWPIASERCDWSIRITWRFVVKHGGPPLKVDNR